MQHELNLQHVTNFVFEVVERAGQVIMANFNLVECAVDPKDLHVGGIDVVTCADRASEDVILSAIKGRFPDHDILSEETGKLQNESPWLWVVDPLDGTMNFAHGYPVFSVSIALLRDGEPLVGMVYDPVSKESFHGFKGGGAHVNGKPISVSWTSRLNESHVGTGFPHDRAYGPDTNVPEFCRVVLAVQGIRCKGSPALDLAYVACGRLDAFWEPRLKPFDLAAGILLVQEAGGRITDRSGVPTDVYTDCVVASNGRVHDKLISLLAP